MHDCMVACNHASMQALLVDSIISNYDHHLLRAYDFSIKSSDFGMLLLTDTGS